LGGVVQEQVAADQLFSVGKHHVVSGKEGEVLPDPRQLVAVALASGGDDHHVVPSLKESPHAADRPWNRLEVAEKTRLREVFVDGFSCPGDPVRPPLVQGSHVDLVAVLLVVGLKPFGDQIAQDSVHVEQDAGHKHPSRHG